MKFFGGYAYQGFWSDDSSTNTNGWDASFTVYPAKYLGITADISVQHKGASAYPFEYSSHVYTYLFGPTLPIETEGMQRLKTKAFVHALLGASSVKDDTGAFGASYFSSTNNPFVIAFGGGVDVEIAKHWSLRLVQADYLQYRYTAVDSDIAVNSFRYSPGVVFKF